MATVDNKHNNNNNKSINNNITNDINFIDTNGTTTLGDNNDHVHHSVKNKTIITKKHSQPSATAATKTNGVNNYNNDDDNQQLTSPLLSRQRHDDDEDNYHDNSKQNDYHHRNNTSSTWSLLLSPLVSSVTDSDDSNIIGNSENQNDHDDDDDDDDMKDSHSMHIADLKTWALGVIIYYNVAGGPFGIEPTVRSSGPLYSLLGFLLAPLIISIPECLVTAELGSTYPGAAGGVSWVTEAFGDTAGLVMGYMSYLSGSANIAIYPVLFLEYVVQLFRDDSDDDDGSSSAMLDVKGRLLFVTGLISLLTLVNYWGLEIVGRMSQVIALVAMSPFFVMIVLGIPKIEPSRWFVPPSPPPSSSSYYDDDDNGSSPMNNNGWFPVILFAGVLWQPYLNNLYWNNNSYDSAAHLSGEIRDLSSTYPHAILLSLLLVSLGNFLPLLIALGATDSTQEDWVDGYLTTACTAIAGGTWLGAWAVFSAGISSLAQFESGLSTESYMIYGMAQRGLLPKVFTRRSRRFHTPTNAILLTYSIVMVMSLADFSSLVEMLNFNYSIALLMEYGAFVKLRMTMRWDDDDDDDDEYADRQPYRIPMPTWACVLMLIPPCVIILLILCMASYLTYIVVAGFVCLGLLVRYMLSVAKVRGWCEFVDHRVEMMIMTDDDQSSIGGDYTLMNSDDDGDDNVEAMTEHSIT